MIFLNAGDGGFGFETMHAHVMAIRSVARLEGVADLAHMPLFKTARSNTSVTGAVLLWAALLTCAVRAQPPSVEHRNEEPHGTY